MNLQHEQNDRIHSFNDSKCFVLICRGDTDTVFNIQYSLEYLSFFLQSTIL